jgi:TRAP-type C4-dicarboxylate transport system substrate-binding protein
MKRIAALALTAVLLLSLSSCGRGGAGVRTLRIATYFGDSHPTSKALAEVFKPLFEDATDGRYKVELYGNNTLGNEEEFTKAVMAGEAEMCIASTVLGSQYPALCAADFPWLFDDVEQASKICNDPEVVALFQEAFDNTGMTCLGLSVNGNRCISNNVRRIESLADLKGLRIRVPNAFQYVSNFEMLGVSTVEMEMDEVMPAILANEIDGQENPPTTLLTSSFYTVQPYLAMTDHQISMNFINVNTDFYNSMSEADREALHVAAEVFIEKQLADYLESLDGSLQVLSGHGVTITYPDRREFKVAAGGIVLDFCGQYPEFNAVASKILSLQLEYGK